MVSRRARRGRRAGRAVFTVTPLNEAGVTLAGLCCAAAPGIVERLERGVAPESLHVMVVHRSSVHAPRDLFEAPDAGEVVVTVSTRAAAPQWARRVSLGLVEGVKRLPARAGEVLCVVLFGDQHRVVSFDPYRLMTAFGWAT